MIVVSDTSPILNLARIGRLELLKSLYERVLVPRAVHGELTSCGRDLSALTDPATIPWLVVEAPKDLERMRELRAELDRRNRSHCARHRTKGGSPAGG